MGEGNKHPPYVPYHTTLSNSQLFNMHPFNYTPRQKPLSPQTILNQRNTELSQISHKTERLTPTA